MNPSSLNEGDSGGPSEPRSDGVTYEIRRRIESADPRILLDAMKKCHEITDTESLVEAYNTAVRATNESQGDMLFDWLAWYINWFDQQDVELLEQCALLEYAELAKIRAVSRAEKEVVKNVFTSLRRKVIRGGSVDQKVVRAVRRAVIQVDAHAFANDPTELVYLADVLLACLRVEQNRPETVFEDQAPALFCLHETLLLIEKKNRDLLKARAMQRTLAVFTEKLEEMKLSSCFAFRFYSSLISRSLQSFLAYKKPFPHAGRLQRLARDMSCAALGDVGSTELAACGVNRLNVGSGLTKLTNDHHRDRLETEPWWHLLQLLNAAGMLCLRDPEEFNLFEGCYSIVLERRTMDPDKSVRNVLLFGILHETRRLAVCGLTSTVRTAAAGKLFALTGESSIQHDCKVERRIFEALLNALCAVHVRGEHQPEVVAVMEAMSTSLDLDLRRAYADWLVEASLGERLHDAREKQSPHVSLKILLRVEFQLAAWTLQATEWTQALLLNAMYNERNELALLALSEKFCELSGASEGALSLLRDCPVDVAVVQSFFLKLKLAEAGLRFAEENERAEDVFWTRVKLLVDSAIALIESSPHSPNLREKMILVLEDLPHINRSFPQLSHPLIEELTSKNVPDSGYRQAAKLAKHLPNELQELTELVSKNAKDEDEWTRTEAMWHIGNIVIGAPKAADSLVSFLAEGSKDESELVRAAVIWQIEDVVAVVPRQADVFLKVLLAGSRDACDAVKKATMWQISGFLSSARQHSEAIASIVEEGLADQSADIRRITVSQIGPVISVSPRRLEWESSVVFKACEDPNNEVRLEAIALAARIYAFNQRDEQDLQRRLDEGFPVFDTEVNCGSSDITCKALEIRPVKSEIILGMLTAVYGDAYLSVHEGAVRQIGQALQAVPDRSDDLLGMLNEFIGDANWLVRKAATNHIGQALQAVPDRSDDLLGMLDEAIGDADLSVREVATNHIGQAFQTVSDISDDLLKMLIEAIGDANLSVREVATNHIGQALQAVPDRFYDLMDMLDGLMEDESASLRVEAALQIKSSLKPIMIGKVIVLQLLLDGANDDCDEVRVSSIQAAEEILHLLPQGKEPLLETALDRIDGESTASGRATREAELEDLLGTASLGQDASAIHRIAERLIDVPVVASESPNPGSLRLQLCDGSSTMIHQDKPESDVNRAVAAIRADLEIQYPGMLAALGLATNQD